MNTNLKAFLDMIAYSEGTLRVPGNDDGYNVVVGGTLFRSYADHPRKRVWFTRFKIWSTAAGRYQILARFFDAYKAQLNLPDFGKVSQDKIAIQMIKECGAYLDAQNGYFDRAIKKCRSRWASLPGAGYGQHENKLADLRSVYLASGGQIAKDSASA